MNISPIIVTKLILPIIIHKNICTHLLQINPLLKAVQLLTNTTQMKKTDHTKITFPKTKIAAQLPVQIFVNPIYSHTNRIHAQYALSDAYHVIHFHGPKQTVKQFANYCCIIIYHLVMFPFQNIWYVLQSKYFSL